MTRSITLVMKATRLCNLRCSYCHDWRAEKDQKMTFDVLARTTAAALRDPEHVGVTFVWHGGEPTIMGMEFFERAMAIQSRFRRPGQVVRNQLQTNGTRITAEWAAFLAKHEFGVGLSLDGPPEIHDRTRIYVNGGPSWSDARRGLETLRAHGVDVSVLLVVDREIMELGPQAVFDFFVAYGIERYGLLAVKPSIDLTAPAAPDPDHYVTPAEMNRFLIEIDGARARHGDTNIKIRELEGLRRKIDGSHSGLCVLEGDCVGDYFLVEPNGEIAHCDLFLGDPAYTLGTVHEASFAELRSTPEARALAARSASEVAAMRECPGFDVCSGWCPHERYISERHDPGHRPGCCGQLELIDHLRSQPSARLTNDLAHPLNGVADHSTKSVFVEVGVALPTT